MRNLATTDPETFYPIYFAVKDNPRDHPTVEGPIDTALAAFLGIAEKPFSTSMEASYELLDALAAQTGDDYTNVDYREYRTNGYVLCDINDDNSAAFHGGGRGATRAEALFQALISAMMYMMED